MAMMNILKHTPPVKALLPAEWATAAWWALTTIALLALWGEMPRGTEMLIDRGWILLGCVAVYSLHRRRPCRLTLFLRTAVQFAWLALWYTETYDFNRLLPNLDHVFASLDQSLFGCQPSLLFSRWLTGTLWSEAFNLGYYSYYCMIFVSAVWMWLVKPREVAHCFGVLLTAFFVYYVIYMLVPVGGPQFYFQAIGVKSAEAGLFPQMGHYFATHTDMLPAPGNPDGLFYRLVAAAQDTGERPTAAFPSSHCGITVMVLMIARRTSRCALLTLLPFALLLFCATVYIQAHYLVDSITGIVTAPLLFHAIDRLWRLHTPNKA